MIPTLKMTLNPIFVLIIITHAQVFECIKKHGGQGYLAAPYCALLSHSAKYKQDAKFFNEVLYFRYDSVRYLSLPFWFFINDY